MQKGKTAEHKLFFMCYIHFVNFVNLLKEKRTETCVSVVSRNTRSSCILQTHVHVA